MKTKIACKKIALLGCGLLALNVFAPVIVKAVPITLTLDDPNQTLASPPSAVTLDFTGTVTIDPNFRVNFAKIDFMCMGNTGICLPLPAFDPAFENFLLNVRTGTFTGLMFTQTVPAGTMPGLYNINVTPPDLSELFIRVISPGGELAIGRESYSVLVTGVGVPDRGSSILLLGLSLAALLSFNALKSLLRREC